MSVPREALGNSCFAINAPNPRRTIEQGPDGLMETKQPRTVLGFDSWTGGAAKFARLVPAFREHGYRLVLLHLGSWGGDIGRPMQEFLDDLEIRDISYYAGRPFDEILALEQPAAVLFLSNDVFAHRAFNRFSQHAGIPTVHLYHGLVGVQAVSNDTLYRVSFVNQTGYVLRRIPKALRYIWPCYARALFKTGASWGDWRRFASDIINMTRGKYIAHAAADARTSAACVYTAADIPHAVSKYGHALADVHVVGNPDIMAFGLEQHHIGAAAGEDTSNREEVIYIDTGLIYAGMVFDGPDDFLAHLVATRDALAKLGRTLAVKLHPQHFRTDFPERVRSAGIDVLTNENFVPRLLGCAGAIVEPSTAALIPAIVGLPLVLAAYGKLRGQRYGDVLSRYPRVLAPHDLDSFAAFFLQAPVTVNRPELSHWIAENAGPLPAREMPTRVANVINLLLRESPSLCHERDEAPPHRQQDAT